MCLREHKGAVSWVVTLGETQFCVLNQILVPPELITCGKHWGTVCSQEAWPNSFPLQFWLQSEIVFLMLEMSVLL